ncbi:Zinc finger HIT domain-containing protein 1 [Tetrabaena socialis]|uniref:Zinc finger HIT domain-containing protein 1 n=1 Tax=Tetrabaena socialis TaxID=47790 RepID=A0A2J7ZRD2_9CHLO|nr:Zinc finger HIT domain-containing protein 1 [Tetrabaena socialis]|eukprot:PNH02833.1 Zinc finger HIT domain-containing protein 1 [Tetrabaena socialis]
MPPRQNAPAKGGRALRERKVSQRMAVVDDATRQQAAQARLDALENDNEQAADPFGMASDDDDFNLEEDDEDEDVGGKKGKGRKKAVLKRKLRSVATDRRGPKNFGRLLEEAELDRLPAGKPNYLTAAAGPSKTSAPRKFCSVCGNSSGYTCARCGSRYCCRKCYTVHTETRCLKFTV